VILRVPSAIVAARTLDASIAVMRFG